MTKKNYFVLTSPPTHLLLKEKRALGIGTSLLMSPSPYEGGDRGGLKSTLDYFIALNL